MSTNTQEHKYLILGSKRCGGDSVEVQWLNCRESGGGREGEAVAGLDQGGGAII
jgi:hypothetical protein